MALLFEVMLFYAALAFLAIVAVWLGIGRSGFVGLQQADSKFAKFFQRQGPVLWVASRSDFSQTNVTMVTMAPAFASTAVMVLVVGQYFNQPGARTQLVSSARGTATRVLVNANADV